MDAMRLATIAALLAVLVAATTASASAINKTDRANAARACTALRASSSTAFANQYATFGACTSAWVQRAHADRMAATTACRAKHLAGKALATCIKSATGKSLAAQTTMYKNAAKACQGELDSLGSTAFRQKYGANGTLRNAFGKCVSRQVSNTGGSGGGSGGASHYTVTFSDVNGSGVGGTGTLLLNGNKLQVKLALTDLSRLQQSFAIRGLSSGQASCPTASSDLNGDGRISESEGELVYGSVLLGLDVSANSTTGWETTVASSLLPLQSRAIVVMGRSPEGISATQPVACGVIVAK